MPIEKHFDIPFISNLALREKQIQQNYRPIIAVHKWFARRPGTLFRGLILSEYSDKPLREAFYSSNDLKGITIADPRKIQVPIKGEWIGDRKNGDSAGEERQVRIICGSATTADLPPASLDGVFTDPPYFGNVQYAELMDFCYVWLRKLAGEGNPAFASHTTRNVNELTGNITMERGLDHFTEGLSAVFQNMAKALKPGRPLAFTYHHNKLEAYHPVAVAILDAGLICSASLPCPAEMGASIHISGTGSSIVDTVLVCRSTGTVARRTLAKTAAEFALLVTEDLDKLQEGGLKPTRGDTRCIIFGHLIRMSIWNLREDWDAKLSAKKKLTVLARQVASLPRLEEVESAVSIEEFPALRMAVNEDFVDYGMESEELVGEVMENAIEKRLRDAGVSYRKTGRAEKIPGFGQAPDFCIPDEISPAVIIEAKVTSDDGTARDKVTRIKELETQRNKHVQEGKPKYEVVACIDGRGFRQRRSDMRDLILRLDGKVFTAATLDHLISNTRISEFVSK